MWTGQVYGHHDKMGSAKTQRTSQNTKYTKTFMCKAFTKHKFASP